MSRSRQGWGLAGLRYASALVLSGAAMAAFAATPESGHCVETVQFAKDSNKAAISGALTSCALCGVSLNFSNLSTSAPDVLPTPTT